MAIIWDPARGDDEPGEDWRDGEPTDLEEAEAIGCGARMLLPERRHLVALMTELQRVRVQRDAALSAKAAVMDVYDDLRRQAEQAHTVRASS